MGALTKVRKKFPYVLLAGVIMASPSAVGAALADSGRFYLGITGAPEWLDTSSRKTVDNTSPLNRTSQSGKVNRDPADETGYGFSLLAGYLAEDWVSFNLRDEGVFVPLRVDNDEGNLSLTLAWYF